MRNFASLAGFTVIQPRLKDAQDMRPDDVLEPNKEFRSVLWSKYDHCILKLRTSYHFMSSRRAAAMRSSAHPTRNNSGSMGKVKVFAERYDKPMLMHRIQ